MNAVERVAEYTALQREEDWLRLAMSGDGEAGSRAKAEQKAEQAALDGAPVGRKEAWFEREGEAKWPRKGEIKFDRYSMRYREDLDDVIRDVSLTIRAGEKVGVHVHLCVRACVPASVHVCMDASHSRFARETRWVCAAARVRASRRC